MPTGRLNPERDDSMIFAYSAALASIDDLEYAYSIGRARICQIVRPQELDRDKGRVMHTLYGPMVKWGEHG